MSRVDALLECLGRSLCEKARTSLAGERPFGDVLPDVAKATLDHARRELPTEELRCAIGELAALPPDAYADRLARQVASLTRAHHVPFADALSAYLMAWPAAVRQVLRRPSDPAGQTAPEGMQFYKPDDLLMFLPPRPPRLRPGGDLPGLEDWRLVEARGMGECSEVWVGTSESQAEHSPAALKFATDPATAAQVVARQDLLVKVFDLNDVPGIVPLRSVYLESNPPCLDVGYVHGYDLTGLIHEWRWRYNAAKPEAAARLIRRIAEIVAVAHAKGIVHRDLKPSNVLLHPTDGGKFTVWVTDFGWGQIAAARSMELHRGGTPRGEQQRLALRGAHTPLYASPQLARKEAPDPRDDVHALGVMWYQLLKRDPHVSAPVGSDWADEFRSAGLSDDHARLLSACVTTRADKRPADAAALADAIAKCPAGTPHPARVDDGSRVVRLKSPSTQSGVIPVARGKAAGAVAAVAPAPARGAANLPRLVTNSVGLTFALIQPGTFAMGAPDDEPGRRSHDGPLRDVKISRPFYLSVFPVTQSQYEQVCRANPSHFTAARGGGPDHPVESVRYHDAELFCTALEGLSEEERLGRAYRLPTEAEWEYACRAGTKGPFYTGERMSQKDAHIAGTGPGGKVISPEKTAPVGSYSPNPWGLYDMCGNVQEWTQDWYDEHYYHDAPRCDPQGPDRGKVKTTRGGCWMMTAGDCRSAARRPQGPDNPSNVVGFRVILVVPQSGR
ncbi:SUMF1/EgtB/PvdO family nonheme iron enzyme [Fimbriiglobus ruber]|uniref:Serine/threonine protein kinase n=1 Tax=Fimbriiglobus ruber TaxID=1908690 RepID=A0A225DLE0_9BACT|nr:SUMF1/EgtB/PvdO family nonheme iron enzyme [Fimbriiglobus ruber]OWK40434.1 Serine/threonine protein kinase [Fimbriiglobus ruber]